MLIYNIMFRSAKSKMVFEYDKKYTLEQRLKESQRIKEKHPGKIPIITEKVKSSDITVSDNFKEKFLLPPDHTIGLFIVELKKRLLLKDEQALFLFINNSVPPIGMTMREVYDKYKDTDDFLKISFGCENTFG